MAKPGKPGRGSPHHHMKPSPFLLVPHKGGKLTLDTRVVAMAFSDKQYLHIALTVGRSPTLEMGGDAQAASDAATALVEAIHSLQEHYGPTPPEQAQPQPSGLPPLPPGEEWHNPENISPSLLEEGYRFMTKSEFARGYTADARAFDDGDWFDPALSYLEKDWTYAVPLATWPLPRP